jgi:hypothetical protein
LKIYKGNYKKNKSRTQQAVNQLLQLNNERQQFDGIKKIGEKKLEQLNIENQSLKEVINQVEKDEYCKIINQAEGKIDNFTNGKERLKEPSNHEVRNGAKIKTV